MEVLLKNGKKLYMKNLTNDDFESFNDFSRKLSEQTIFTNQYPGQPDKDRNLFAKAKDDDNSISIGLFDGDRQLGNIFISIERPEHPWCCHVATFGMGVLKEIEGNGAGSLLLKEAIIWAKNKNLKRIEGTVRTGNMRGISLYLKFGFEIEGCKKRTAFINGKWHDEYAIGKLL